LGCLVIIGRLQMASSKHVHSKEKSEVYLFVWYNAVAILSPHSTEYTW